MNSVLTSESFLTQYDEYHWVSYQSEYQDYQMHPNSNFIHQKFAHQKLGPFRCVIHDDRIGYVVLIIRQSFNSKLFENQINRNNTRKS